jgi:hypothetical protein
MSDDDRTCITGIFVIAALVCAAFSMLTPEHPSLSQAVAAEFRQPGDVEQLIRRAAEGQALVRRRLYSRHEPAWAELPPGVEEPWRRDLIELLKIEDDHAAEFRRQAEILRQLTR